MAPDPWSLHALLHSVILDPSEVDELKETLFVWMQASLACLVAFAAVHVAVRLVSRLGFGHRSSSLAQRLAWATLYAVFPEAKAVQWNPGVGVVATRWVGAIRRHSRGEGGVGRGGERATGKLSASTPTLPSMKPARSRASVAARRLSTIGEHVLEQAHERVGYFIGVVALELAVAVAAPVAFRAAGPALRPFTMHGKMALSGLVAARVVAPLGVALRETCEKILDEWVNGLKVWCSSLSYLLHRRLFCRMS